jgi:hypothetical protein
MLQEGLKPSRGIFQGLALGKGSVFAPDCGSCNARMQMRRSTLSLPERHWADRV